MPVFLLGTVWRADRTPRRVPIHCRRYQPAELLSRFFLMVDFVVQFDTMKGYYNVSTLLFFNVRTKY